MDRWAVDELEALAVVRGDRIWTHGAFRTVIDVTLSHGVTLRFASVPGNPEIEGECAAVKPPTARVLRLSWAGAASASDAGTEGSA